MNILVERNSKLYYISAREWGRANEVVAISPYFTMHGPIKFSFEVFRNELSIVEEFNEGTGI